MREEGFYWVKGNDGFNVIREFVAEWVGYCWLLPGYEEGHSDSDFSEIDERRIERQP